mgnify:FL=1
MALKQEKAKVEPAVDALEELERSMSVAQAMSEYEAPSTYLEPPQVSIHNMGNCGEVCMRPLSKSLQDELHKVVVTTTSPSV